MPRNVGVAEDDGDIVGGLAGFKRVVLEDASAGSAAAITRSNATSPIRIRFMAAPSLKRPRN
jgi:hypothetical protein